MVFLSVIKTMHDCVSNAHFNFRAAHLVNVVTRQSPLSAMRKLDSVCANLESQDSSASVAPLVSGTTVLKDAHVSN